MFLWAFATIFVAFISRDLIKKYFLPNKKPPLASGALPVLGHLYTIDFSNLHEEIQRIAKDTGSVFRIVIGGRDWVVLASYELIKKLFEDDGDRYILRPEEFINYEITCGDNLGLLYSNGPAWNDQRRFIFNSLHQLCLSSIPEKVTWQLGKLVQIMEKHASEGENGRSSGYMPIYFKDLVHGIFADILLGIDYHFSSNEFTKLQENLHKVSGVLVGGNAHAVNHWPWVRCLPFDMFGYKKFYKANQDLESQLEKLIDSKKAGNFNEHDRDLADVYLQEMHRRQLSGDGPGYFSKKQLLRSIVDMWALGSEKVAEMLNHLILFMVRYPDIQEKCHLEIQENVGYDRNIRADDRENLKYLRACIIEAHRIGSVADVTYLHTSRHNTRIGDFEVPKGTAVIASLYTVHMNPEKYLQPEKYIPERFVDRDLRHVTCDPEIIPYGIGRRSCVGEDLSKMLIFMIFATMIQKFKFLALPGRDFPDLKYVRENTLHPVLFKCAIEKRNTDVPEKVDIE